MSRWFVVAAVGWAMTAFAIVPETGTTPAYTQVAVNNGAGDSFDPHVSGDIAAYTHEDVLGQSAIHYYRFSTATDATIPLVANTVDLLSDTDGDLVVFSRINSSNGDANINVFDTGSSTLTLIDPHASPVHRIDASLGGGTLAYIDQGLESQGELVIHDMASNTSQRITNDTDGDTNPSVSSDGSVVVWQKCIGGLSGPCSIWQAVKSGSSWTTSQAATDPAGDELPDTNGSLMVYSSNRPTGNGDIFFRSVIPGPESEIQVPGIQDDPNMAGKYIAFVSAVDSSSPNDVYLYDVSLNQLYQITNTTFNEALNDVTVLADGSVRLIWENDEAGSSSTHVYAATISFGASGTGGGGGSSGTGGGSSGGGMGGGGGQGGGGDQCDGDGHHQGDDDDCDGNGDGDGHGHGDGDGHGDDGNGCSWGGHGWHHSDSGQWHFHHGGHEQHHHGGGGNGGNGNGNGWGWGHHGDGHCCCHHGGGHHWGDDDGHGNGGSSHHEDSLASSNTGPVNGAMGCNGTGGAPWLVLAALVLIALSRRPQPQLAKIRK